MCLSAQKVSPAVFLIDQRRHSKTAEVFGTTGIVLTDCDYSLLLDGQETTHHFMVTEIYSKAADEWKLVAFSSPMGWWIRYRSM